MTPTQVRNLGAALENTGANLPGVVDDWKTIDRDQQVFYADSLQELAANLEELARCWLANLNPEDKQ